MDVNMDAKMDDEVELVRRLYADFNARNIDSVLAVLAEDVVWANGMDGGHVRGREAVRAYWTRQWAVVSPHVEPVSFRRAEDGAVLAEVVQSVRDLQGRPAGEAAGGLRDRTVWHLFRLRDGAVARFDVRDDAEGA